jgi:GNAT superfamily N-acetyltransferase
MSRWPMAPDLPTLVGEGVTLVPVRPGSAAALMAGDLGGRTAGRGWPHDDTAPGLAFADAGGLTWLVLDADGLVVGELGTKSEPDADGAVEIGYGLAAPSRGLGLGSRAVAVLLDWLAARPDIRRVVANVAIDNAPSVRLLEKLGFRSLGPGAPGELAFEWSAP